MFSWGKGEDGQLGRAVTEDRLPTPIDALNGKKVQMVSAGYGHSVFVTGTHRAELPLRGALFGFSFESLSWFVLMFAGVCVWWLVANGEIYSCGKNAAGELGRGAVSQSESVPAAVDGLKDVKIKQVEAGGQHTLALTADGNVYSWGMRPAGGAWVAKWVGAPSGERQCFGRERDIDTVFHVGCGGLQALVATLCRRALWAMATRTPCWRPRRWPTLAT